VNLCLTPPGCPGKIEVHGRIYGCGLGYHLDQPCRAKVVVAGFEEPELGPNIWTYVQWRRRAESEDQVTMECQLCNEVHCAHNCKNAVEAERQRILMIVDDEATRYTRDSASAITPWQVAQVFANAVRVKIEAKTR